MNASCASQKIAIQEIGNSFGLILSIFLMRFTAIIPFQKLMRKFLERYRQPVPASIEVSAKFYGQKLLL